MTQMSDTLRQTIADESADAKASAEAALIDAIRADGYDEDAVQAWSDYTGEDVTEWDAPTRDAFSDAFQGVWGSMLEFATQLFDDVYYEVVEAAEANNYLTVDYEQFAYDLEVCGEYYISDDGYVFRCD